MLGDYQCSKKRSRCMHYCHPAEWMCLCPLGLKPEHRPSTLGGFEFMGGCPGCCRRRSSDPWFIVDEDTHASPPRLLLAPPTRGYSAAAATQPHRRYYASWLPEAPPDLPRPVINVTRLVLRLLTLRRAQLRFHALGEGCKRVSHRILDDVRRVIHYYPGRGSRGPWRIPASSGGRRLHHD